MSDSLHLLDTQGRVFMFALVESESEFLMVNLPRFARLHFDAQIPDTRPRLRRPAPLHVAQNFWESIHRCSNYLWLVCDF